MMWRVTVFAWVLALVSTPSFAAVVWDESVNGDLSINGFAPTSVPVSPGVNSIVGWVGNPHPVENDLADSFVLEVPDGFKRSGVLLRSYVPYFEDFWCPASFVPATQELQMASASAFDDVQFRESSGYIGASRFDVSHLGADIAPGDHATLPAGHYVWHLSSLPRSGSADYQIDFVISPIPEPGVMAAMAALGLLTLGRRVSAL